MDSYGSAEMTEEETPMLRAASGGSSLQQRGQETEITPIPKHVPVGLPETVNFTHVLNVRYYFETSGDDFNDHFDGFNVAVKLNDPWNATTPSYSGGGVLIGTQTASDDGSIAARYSTAATPSFFQYFATMYKYWTVTHTNVKAYYRDFGFRTGNMTHFVTSVGTRPYNRLYDMDYPYLMYRDYGSQKDPEATLTTYNGRALMDDRHMKCKQFSRSFVDDEERFAYAGVGATESAKSMWKRPVLDCQIEENFTHKSYERLMDVAGDSSDVIWTAVGANHPLSHVFEIRHRYWDTAGANVTMSSSVKYFVFVDVRVEYQMQWKELNTTNKLHRAYYGVPTFP